MYTEHELPCSDHHKSFYGKAIVIESARGKKYLKSYKTIVGYLDKNNTFHRTWGGYSATTMRHVNSFLAYFNLPGGGKQWWDGLKVEPSPEL